MKPEGLLDGLRTAADGGAGIRCQRLLSIEPEAFASIRSEVLTLCADRSPSRVTERGHVTAWVLPYGEVLQYSLYNSTGHSQDFADDHDLTRRGKYFGARAGCPVLGRLVDALPDLVNVRVAVLGPGAGLSPHQEQVFIRAPDGGVVARLRFHLPVMTDPSATLTLDEEVVHLAEGGVYLVNHGCVHAARNAGDRRRVHLLWDQVLTPEVFELVGGPGPVVEPFVRVAQADQRVEPVARARLTAVRRLPRTLSEPELRAAGLARDQWWRSPG